jgi:DNA repair exonuclease SbcCD ATPase subunit
MSDTDSPIPATFLFTPSIKKSVKITCKYEKQISNINNRLSKLNKEKNFNEIMKEHKCIESELSGLETEFNKIKTNFETSIKNINKKKKVDIIDDITYDKYLQELEKDLSDISDKIDLDDQINKYKT